MKIHFAVFPVLALPLSLAAQWPAYKNASAPRLASGQVNLHGPAPKMPDGKPDLSGIWERSGPGGPPPGGPPPGDLPPGRGGRGGGRGPLMVDGIPAGDFMNLGRNMPGGRLPYQPKAGELRDARFARNSKDHPDAHCLPLNPVQLWFHPQPRKLIQTPKELVMLAEANGGLRQIFTDGRPLPAGDPQPWWMGYSVGHWESGTLVVETIGFLDNAWIDEQGSPLSAGARVIERFRRPDYGTLEIQITVDDPHIYTRAFTVNANQRLMPDDELIEFVCGENEKSVIHLH